MTLFEECIAALDGHVFIMDDTTFEYHEVYSDGKYIFDPRYNNNPILKDDYIKMISDLNGGRINIDVLK